MIRYVVTRSRSRGDFGLSKPGHWGGRRFATEAEANLAAARDASGSHSIALEVGR